MKKLVAITTSLCAVACTAVFSGTAALAESGGLDYYPQSFTKQVAFDSLEDYAVGKDKYAFLEKNVIFEYSGGKFYSFEDGSFEVTGVYYKDGTTLCYGTAEGIFEHGTTEPVEIETDSVISANGYVYSESENGEGLVIYKLGSETTEILEGFSNPKIYGGTVYAVSNNSLYTLNGTESEEVVLEYPDYSPTKTISVGSAPQTIKEFCLEAPVFVTLKNGAFMTEINIDSLGGAYFAAGDTVKTGTDVKNGTALLLAKVGAEEKISIVMVNERGGTKSKCYIMNTDDAPVKQREAVKEKSIGATVTVDDAFIYSAPFVCGSTQLAGVNSGDALKVTGEISREDNPELVRDFYKVEYTDEGGQTHTGYVPVNYVSPFAFIENPPVETPDPDYTEENLIKTVVLIIIVVVLVLAAGGYVVYALWTGKFKKKDKNKDGK